MQALAGDRDPGRSRSRQSIDLRSLAGLLIGQIANPKAPGLVRVLANVGAYAKVDRSEVVLDRQAFISAILVSGVEQKATWSADQDVAQFFGITDHRSIKRRHDDAEILKALTDGATPVLSRSMQAEVLPRAVDLARASVGRSVIDLRHLVLALAEHSGTEWAVAGRRVDAPTLLKMRTNLVERIGSNPERNEKVDVLRREVSQRPSEGTAEVAKAPQQDERVNAVRDDPSSVDLLNRMPFARILANRIREVRERLEMEPQFKAAAGASEDRAFIIHLDGPWGAGKSTILRFVEQELKAATPAWKIVTVNAWREQAVTPPWWSILIQVRHQLYAQSDFGERLRLTLAWAKWRLLDRWLAFSLMTLALLLIGWLLFSSPISPELEKAVKLVVPAKDGVIKDTATVFTGVASLFAVFRGLVLGSDKVVAITELKGDPHEPVVRTFERLVSAVKSPVLIIVDDIDRCSGPQVVALLESIQTTLRRVPVAYLVAGDRNWIAASFERAYAEYNQVIGTVGRSLGHHFLDKIFQLSVSVPRISHEARKTYWNGLLQRGKGEETAKAAVEDEAKRRVATSVNSEELQSMIATATSVDEQRALRAAAAERIATPAVATELEHRLAPLQAILEPNPRAMKRLVNALGVVQAVLILEGREFETDVVARWTIIELRWPQFAQRLVANSGWLIKPDTAEQTWQGILSSREFQDVVKNEETALKIQQFLLQDARASSGAATEIGKAA